MFDFIPALQQVFRNYEIGLTVLSVALVAFLIVRNWWKLRQDALNEYYKGYPKY